MAEVSNKRYAFSYGLDGIRTHTTSILSALTASSWSTRPSN